MKYLFENKNYISPYYDYIISRYIREYDMQKSNISILYDKNIIGYDEYTRLFNAPREYRQEFVGKMILRNSNIQNILNVGVIEAKEKLFKANNIKEYEVLSIKNDAVFVLDRSCNITDFGNIKFVNKNIYTSYYRVDKKELYYYFNRMNEEEYLHVKGISDSKLELHKDYMLEFLKILFCTAETETLEDCIELLMVFLDKYRKLELEVEYYRDFNAESLYTILPTRFMGTFKTINIKENQKLALNINCNLHLINELCKIFSDLYLAKNKM